MIEPVPHSEEMPMANDPSKPNANAVVEKGKTRLPTGRLRYPLDKLLSGVTPDEVHRQAAEIDWGPDVGREIIED